MTGNRRSKNVTTAAGLADALFSPQVVGAVMLDLDAEGAVIGIEVLDVRERMKAGVPAAAE